jgi:phytanoyl-CoA dioxygenase PhyH
MIERKGGYLTVRTGPAPQASSQLEQEGYVLLEGAFSPAEVETLKSEINEVFERVPPDNRSKRPAQANEMFRYGMLNRSPAAQQAIAHRSILDVIEPLLGEDCHVIANTAWRNPPNSQGNHGGERWHIDAGPHIPLPAGVSWPTNIPHPVFAIGVHIYLQACELEDGPTGIIPGSHLSGQFPPLDQTLDENLRYQDRGVVPLLANPGDIGLFVSDVWHRRMPSLPGDHGRFFLQVHYGRRDIAQRILTTDEVNHLSAAAIERATSARQKSVIGLHQPFFYDG